MFAENTIKIVFSAEHSFCVSQILKPLSRPLPKMALLNSKVSFGVSPVPAENPIFVVFGDFVWSQKSDISQTESVNENARFFTLRTPIVFADFS